MFKFKVMPDGGDEFTVVATSRDVAKWEKTTKGASLAKLQGDMHAGDLYRVVFHAAVRQGLWTGTLAEFEERVDIEDVDDEEAGEPDPTRSAA